MTWEILDYSTVLIYKVKVIFELCAIFGPLYFEQEKNSLTAFTFQSRKFFASISEI